MARESIDKSLLQTFVPVNALSGDQLDWLLDQQEVRRYEAGDVLFRQGDRDNTTIYLLSGEVELFSEHGERAVISAGEAMHYAHNLVHNYASSYAPKHIHRYARSYAHTDAPN